MRWSKYNMLFKSEKFGHMLYNSLTNTFAEADEVTLEALQAIRKDPHGYDFTDLDEFLAQLRDTKVLVEDGEEQAALNIRRMQRTKANFSTKGMSLTIAPTLSCNFACTYCYQQGLELPEMSPETQAAIIEHVRQEAPKELGVVWFGGEPSLRFGLIKRLTAQFKEVVEQYRAAMITNGYLMDGDMIASLDDLKVENIQITIDGPQDIHDARRVLKEGGGPTFERIMENIGRLLDSPWQGALALRINVDKENLDRYAQTHNMLLKKFASQRLSIYPGIVLDAPGGNADLGCSFDRKDEADFYIELYQKYGLDPKNCFYPDSAGAGCAATSVNHLMIGPSGETYACWQDIGMPQRVIGRMQAGETAHVFTNQGLFAQYLVGVDQFEDRLCKKCFLLPVCDGGCAMRRARRKYDGEELDTCASIKGRIKEFLEIFYQQQQNPPAE